MTVKEEIIMLNMQTKEIKKATKEIKDIFKELDELLEQQ